MTHRLLGGMLLLGAAVACGGTKEVNEPGSNLGRAGAHSGGASAASADGGSPDEDAPGGVGGSAGEDHVGGDRGGEAGASGAAAVHFWTDVTLHIEVACFGFFDGFATFRAERAELSAEQLTLLARQAGVPGSSYSDGDDQIHCVVTTLDALEHERNFTIDGSSELIGPATGISEPGGDGGAGPADYPVSAVLGCEFHHPFPDGQLPFLANPRCLRQIRPEGSSTGFGFNLATADKPYHIELVHCSPRSVANITVELFGTDPATPLAVGTAPIDPGPDEACLTLDAQVQAPLVGRLVFSSASAADISFVFR